MLLRLSSGHGWARRISAPGRPRPNVERSIEPGCRHGGDCVRRRVAAAAIDPDRTGAVSAELAEAGGEIVTRLEFSICDVAASRRMNGARNVTRAGLRGIAHIRRTRPRIEEARLLREASRFIGIDRGHVA